MLKYFKIITDILFVPSPQSNKKSYVFQDTLQSLEYLLSKPLCGFLNPSLTNAPIYTPSKYQKTLGFLVFSGGIKWEYCWLKISNIYLLLLSGMKKHQFPSRHLFKVNTRNTSTRCEICSKLTMETLERRQ